MQSRDCWAIEAVLFIVLAPTIAFSLLVALHGWPEFSAFSWGSFADWLGAIGSGSAAVGAVWIAVRNEKNRSQQMKLDGAIEIIGGRTALGDVRDSLVHVADQIAYYRTEVDQLQRSLEKAGSRLNWEESEVALIEGRIPDDMLDRQTEAKLYFEEALTRRDEALNEYVRNAELIDGLLIKLSTIQYTTAARFSTQYSRSLLGARDQLTIAASAVRRQMTELESASAFDSCANKLDVCLSFSAGADTFVLNQ